MTGKSLTAFLIFVASFMLHSEVREGFIKVESTSVFIKTSSGVKEPLLLLHGFGAHTSSFDAIMSLLGDSFFLVAYDRPGFGFTSRENPSGNRANQYSTEFQPELILHIMDSLSIEKAHICGNSAGGYISLLFASEHPERTESVILLDASSKSREISSLSRFMLSLWPVKQIATKQINKIFSKEGPKTIKRAWHDTTKLSLKTIEKYKEPMKQKHWDRALLYVTLYSQHLLTEEMIKSIEAPVLVLHGENDSIINKSSSFKIDSLLKNSKLLIIPECGHLPHEEKPELVCSLIVDFLKEIRNDVKDFY